MFLDLTDLIDEASRWTYDESIVNVRLATNYVYKNSKKKEKFTKKNFKLLNNVSSYINYHSRNLREFANIKLNEKRKIKTSIQGSFTYKDLNSLDKRFWKNGVFLKGKNNLKKDFLKFQIFQKKIILNFFL